MQVETLKFPLRSTIEQIKKKFFDDFVPPKYKKNPWFMVIQVLYGLPHA
jgi:hypothetical protein